MANYRALVIGIDDYPPPNQLPSCVNDANAMSALLRSLGFEVRRMLNAEATKEGVVAALTELLQDAGPDDRLVFYYSGHGYTDRQSGLMEEYLVLVDGLFEDDALSDLTQAVAPGVLTLILDSCFSGGMEKYVIRPESGDLEVEVAKVKAWQPTPDDLKRFHVERPVAAKGKAMGVPEKVRFRKFGLSPAATKTVIAKSASLPTFAPSAKAFGGGGATGVDKAPDSDEVGQTQTQGLVVSACLEIETAAASTSATDGKSAFTYAMLSAVRELGGQQPTNAIFRRAAELLKELNFRQTPLVMAPPAMPDLASHTFLKLKATTPSASASAPTSAAPADSRLLAVLLAAIVPALVDLRLKALLPQSPLFEVSPQTPEGQAPNLGKVLSQLVAACIAAADRARRPLQ